MSKLTGFLSPLLEMLGTPASAAYANLTGNKSYLRCDLSLLVNMAYLIYQGLLDNRLWQSCRKKSGSASASRSWAYDDYDRAGTNTYIPLDYGNDSWSLRSR